MLIIHSPKSESVTTQAELEEKLTNPGNSGLTARELAASIVALPKGAVPSALPCSVVCPPGPWFLFAHHCPQLSPRAALLTWPSAASWDWTLYVDIASLSIAQRVPVLRLSHMLFPLGPPCVQALVPPSVVKLSESQGLI